MSDKHFVLIGPKHVGKTTVGHLLAKKTGRLLVDTDLELEKIYYATTKKQYAFAKIYKLIGEKEFRSLEQTVCKNLMNHPQPSVIALGGSTLFNSNHCSSLVKQTKVIYLQAELTTLLKRWRQSPPGFVKSLSIEKALNDYYQKRIAWYEHSADLIVPVGEKKKQKLLYILLSRS